LVGGKSRDFRVVSRTVVIQLWVTEQFASIIFIYKYLKSFQLIMNVHFFKYLHSLYVIMLCFYFKSF